MSMNFSNKYLNRLENLLYFILRAPHDDCIAIKAPVYANIYKLRHNRLQISCFHLFNQFLTQQDCSYCTLNSSRKCRIT
jgi:hypothetical protein